MRFVPAPDTDFQYGNVLCICAWRPFWINASSDLKTERKRGTATKTRPAYSRTGPPCGVSCVTSSGDRARIHASETSGHGLVDRMASSSGLRCYRVLLNEQRFVLLHYQCRNCNLKPPTCAASTQRLPNTPNVRAASACWRKKSALCDKIDSLVYGRALRVLNRKRAARGRGGPTDHDEGKRRRGRSLDTRDPGHSVPQPRVPYHQVESRIYDGQFSRPPPAFSLSRARCG
jgi:hypothetical protein